MDNIFNDFFDQEIKIKNRSEKIKDIIVEIRSDITDIKIDIKDLKDIIDFDLLEKEIKKNV